MFEVNITCSKIKYIYCKFRQTWQTCTNVTANVADGKAQLFDKFPELQAITVVVEGIFTSVPSSLGTPLWVHQRGTLETMHMYKVYTHIGVHVYIHH